MLAGIKLFVISVALLAAVWFLGRKLAPGARCGPLRVLGWARVDSALIVLIEATGSRFLVVASRNAVAVEKLCEGTKEGLEECSKDSTPALAGS
ncbi:hypothetical protein SAMN00808754_1551 [Thermanaeromonas toyohensis ToBE]|uniref:Uncharacterized protein n=1 Tax=Thermanaeromonas toyohensis ToBE TaxID=698762 RepID=A0A1W1VTN8_9FIRM|nr:hypothetical protein [Thermanaeromonas toyohensis]SMB96600.1 hypothetical protein SAMN00808754_1551 [Thermanaeromonas toyohensis ToBE]